MSRGNPRITVRIPEELIEQIEKELASQAEHSPFGPEDLSEFIRRAIVERIAKRQRSRAPRRGNKNRDVGADPLANLSLTRWTIAEEGMA